MTPKDIDLAEAISQGKDIETYNNSTTSGEPPDLENIESGNDSSSEEENNYSSSNNEEEENFSEKNTDNEEENETSKDDTDDEEINKTRGLQRQLGETMKALQSVAFADNPVEAFISLLKTDHNIRKTFEKKDPTIMKKLENGITEKNNLTDFIDESKNEEKSDNEIIINLLKGGIKDLEEIGIQAEVENYAMKNNLTKAEAKQMQEYINNLLKNDKTIDIPTAMDMSYTRFFGAKSKMPPPVKIGGGKSQNNDMKTSKEPNSFYVSKNQANFMGIL